MPSDCNAIETALNKLLVQEDKKRIEIGTLTGADKWSKLQDLGSLRKQISEQQKLLSDCRQEHSDDLVTEISVTDVTGAAGASRVVRLWQLTPSGQVLRQTATLKDGKAQLVNVPKNNRQSHGITVEETDQPDLNGPDFRSGILPPPPPSGTKDPVERIEIVLLDPILITSNSLISAIPKLPIQLSYANGPLGTVNINVTSMEFTTANGALGIVAKGNASGVGISSPFAFSGGVHLVPSFDMKPSFVVNAQTEGSPTLEMPGLIGSIARDIIPLISSSILEPTLRPLITVINDLLTRKSWWISDQEQAVLVRKCRTGKTRPCISDQLDELSVPERRVKHSF